MDSSNLFPNIFEHCEMASQVPKRVVVAFGRGIQISVLAESYLLSRRLGKWIWNRLGSCVSEICVRKPDFCFLMMHST